MVTNKCELTTKVGALVFFLIVLLLPSGLGANFTYIGDLGFSTSQAIYSTQERIELKGFLYVSNYSTNGSLMQNHTAYENATVNVSIISKATNQTTASYLLNSSIAGQFNSRNNFDTNATQILAPNDNGTYFIKVNYTDPNGTAWWTQTEIEVLNQTVDRLEVRGDKVSYNPSDAMVITVEAIQDIGGEIVFVENVTINGSIRNASKSVLSNFSCLTGRTGKCLLNATVPASNGKYFLEVNNFKGFTSFQVRPFRTTIAMKDELGQSIKHVFIAGDQASVEVGAITNVTTETYTFVGVVKNSAGSIMQRINTTTLNTTNSYINRYTFTLNSINFSVGSYQVEVNVTKTGDGTVQAFSSFEVRSWSMSFKKRDTRAGFEYQYSAFPNKSIFLEIYPTWRGNGTLISNLNTTTELNVSLYDTLNNEILTANETLNTTCGTDGCYTFNLTTPITEGVYYLQVSVRYDGNTQIIRKLIKVIGATIFAQATDENGQLKDLFGTDDYTYITLSSRNRTHNNVNATKGTIKSIVYMNGTELNYTEADNFSVVNTSNSALEWAWNKTLQRFKIDTPQAGGVYSVQLSTDNNTAAASARFIVNPFDVCVVAKDNAGQAGGSTGNYYSYQFKTSDIIYFELKITRANNQGGRANSLNLTAGGNSTHGIGEACSVDTETEQVVNNATITVEEVRNMDTGKVFNLNATDTNCQGDDTSGGYTCTIKSIGNWDGGKYGVKLKVLDQNGQTSDIAYGGFEARAFYLYAYPSTWYNKPSDNVDLTIDMYEAGNNWWGSVGSGGLTGTVTLERVEYQGREGEWFWPPIDYTDFNESQTPVSTITNGRGTMSLNANNVSGGAWKTGNYRAILKGVDADGTTDYGYAHFQIRRWEVYASPIDCSTGSCYSKYNINSKQNVSLYVTVNNAGEWGTGGNSLGGDVVISVKKLQDCRKWPCSEVNASLYNATSINVSASSNWYWNGAINYSYMINLTPVKGSWGTGYYQVILDVNGSENGRGWFNTIAFYVRMQPTDSTGTNWQNSIKNYEPKHFSVTTVKSQVGGYHYNSYNNTDYLNTTIQSATLRRWDSLSNQYIEYKYPTDFNISLVGGGATINGSKVLNFTYFNGTNALKNWSSGYYNGEVVLKDLENQTANGWVWFQVRPFRVNIVRETYEIDSTECVNGTINIYEPDWRTNTFLNGTYNISSVQESVWQPGGSRTITTYTNFTPSVTFNDTNYFRVCPNNGKWGAGSWSNYHHLTVRVTNSAGLAEDGWVSFKTVPFATSWSLIGGTNKLKTADVQINITVTKATSGDSTSGNLTKIYQWRSDGYRSREESYTFSVGTCDTSNSGTTSCKVNGTQTVTISAPTDGWKEGYNYLQAEWSEHDDSGSTLRDYNGVNFNGQDVYSGSWYNRAEDQVSWKSEFAESDNNVTIELRVQDNNNRYVTVNLTKMEYSTPTETCWDEYCRTYNDGTYSIVGQAAANNTINGSGAVVRVERPSASNWTRGTMYFRATISGANGTTVITGGQIRIKDLTNPTVNITVPKINATINTSRFWLNWTTTENADCNINLYEYDRYSSWYCSGWNNSNSTNSSEKLGWINSCNTTKYGFNGSSTYSEYINKGYRSWSFGGSWGSQSGANGLTTGGLTHSYEFSASGWVDQDYGIVIWCNDQDWNYGQGYTAFQFNISSTNTTVNVTLIRPLNASNVASYGAGSVDFNYTLKGTNTTNCSLYGNFSGSWALNTTGNNVSTGDNNFTITLMNSSTYLWNVFCEAESNSTNFAWGINRTVMTNASPTTNSTANVTLKSPQNWTRLNTTTGTLNFNYTLAGPTTSNCSLYGNFSGSWALNITKEGTTVGDNNFTIPVLNGTYVWNVYCLDTSNASNTDWGLNRTVNVSYVPGNQSVNVTLTSPNASTTFTEAQQNITFNFTLDRGTRTNNCSLYGNFSGSWALNKTINDLSLGPYNFSDISLWSGGYIWNVYCFETENTSNNAWGINITFPS